MRVAGIILCGGKSSRMGVPKLSLPFGNELMLQRVVRLLREAVQPIVVVGAPAQELPPLPEDVIVVRDERYEFGPLEGMRVGLQVLLGRADAAYVTSCDVPLLVPAFVRRMSEEFAEFHQRGSGEIAVPHDAQFHHWLAAVYDTATLFQVERILNSGQHRLGLLLQHCWTREVPVEELRAVDPELTTLENINHLDDYYAALAKAGC